MQRCNNSDGSYNCSCDEFFKPDLTDWRKCVGESDICRNIFPLYNNQINARALIFQSAVGYCVGKPTEKSRVF